MFAKQVAGDTKPNTLRKRKDAVEEDVDENAPGSSKRPKLEKVDAWEDDSTVDYTSTAETKTEDAKVLYVLPLLRRLSSYTPTIGSARRQGIWLNPNLPEQSVETHHSAPLPKESLSRPQRVLRLKRSKRPLRRRQTQPWTSSLAVPSDRMPIFSSLLRTSFALYTLSIRLLASNTLLYCTPDNEHAAVAKLQWT
jgi:hypothetical protein